MTAAEASRHFSAVLDKAEQGETVVATSGSRQVAATTSAAVIAHSFALAPEEIEVEEFLSTQLNPQIAGIVASLDNEYQAVTVPDNPARGIYLKLLIASSPAATVVSAADKVVLLEKLPHTKQISANTPGKP